MPHFQLASKALYRVSRLPVALQALDFENNAAGYAELERQVSRREPQSETISIKSVQLMMYQGQFLRHRKCAVIKRNVMLEATHRGIPNIVDDQFIDEHEWYISRLEPTLQRAALHLRKSAGDMLEIVAEAADVSREFVGEMIKHRRCLRSEAETVRAAIIAMAPEIFCAGKSEGGKIGVQVAQDPIDGKEALPITTSVRKVS